MGKKSNKEIYEWHLNKNIDRWELSGLFTSQKFKTKLPFLNDVPGAAEAWINLDIFPEKPFNTPYTTKELSNNNEQIVLKKVYEKNAYKGNIDTFIDIRYTPDQMDGFTGGIAYFLNGKFVAGGSSGVRSANHWNLKDFRKGIGKFFFPDGKINFGEYFPEFFRNSNLSQDKRDAIRELIESK